MSGRGLAHGRCPSERNALSDKNGRRHAILKSRSDMVAMTAAMMVRIGLLAIGGNLVCVAFAVTGRSRLARIDATDRFHGVRDRRRHEGQHQGATCEKGEQPDHLLAGSTYFIARRKESGADMTRAERISVDD